MRDERSASGLCAGGIFLWEKGGNGLKRTKRALIWRFLRPYLWLFALTLAFSMGNTVLSSLTPQVVRVAVDSILGGEPLPKVVTALAPPALLAAGIVTGAFTGLAAAYLLKALQRWKVMRRSLRDMPVCPALCRRLLWWPVPASARLRLPLLPATLR